MSLHRFDGTSQSAEFSQYGKLWQVVLPFARQLGIETRLAAAVTSGETATGLVASSSGAGLEFVYIVLIKASRI